MTHDLQEIKHGLAQARAALDLLEQFIAEYESRTVNVLPCEEVKFYIATDEQLASAAGMGKLSSLQDAIRNTARAMAEAETA
jgi:hypothetical protein